jgi:xylulokinase
VAKLGWQVAHGADAVRWWLGVPELCLHALTGARATDFSLAARTGAYDVVRGAPMPEVVGALGLPGDVFPEPAPAGAVMGSVSAAGQRWLGLPVGVPVTVAGHDHLAGMVGSGAGADDLVNSVGTAETVLRRSAGRPDVGAALAAGVAVSLWPTGDGWVVLAGAARAGLVLYTAAGALGRLPAELDASAEEAGAVDAAAWVAATADAVRAAAPLPSGAIPPLPAGRPGAVWNGVLRALSERTWEAARRAEAVAGPSTRLVVVGGGSRSRPWLRAKAAAGHLPVARATVPEAAARGAALFGGVAAGWWPSTEAAPSALVEPV